jgi:gamma-glutamylcyclotransferase (GGCT)/AIG2-like uncharacterized protein YtfP
MSCDPGDEVEGELWQVDEECLRMLDGIEGVSFGLYKREEIELADGQKAITYIYCDPDDKKSELQSCGTSWEKD